MSKCVVKISELSQSSGFTYCAVGLLKAHEVDDECSGGDEEDLHEGVVQRDVVHEEIEVANAKHDQVHLLRFARQAYIQGVIWRWCQLTNAVATLLDAVEEDQDSRKVEHVRDESEDVHYAYEN